MAFGEPAPDNKSKSAEGILTQIKGLLNQYQDLGESTPLASEVRAFEEDVDRALDRIKGGEASAVEEPAPELEDSSPSNFRDARKAAGDAMRNGTLKSDRGGTKTDEEQSPDEDDDKKKRAKAY